MPIEVESKNNCSGSAAKKILTTAFVILAVASFSNTLFVLSAYHKLNEISRQCAISAANEKDAGAAKSAAQKVVELKKNSLYLKQPITCEIVYFGKTISESKSNINSGFAIVKTTASAWIPIPQLFWCVPNGRKTFRFESNTINIEALQSAPFIPMSDPVPQQNGRLSI